MKAVTAIVHTVSGNTVRLGPVPGLTEDEAERQIKQICNISKDEAGIVYGGPVGGPLYSVPVRRIDYIEFLVEEA